MPGRRRSTASGASIWRGCGLRARARARCRWTTISSWRSPRAVTDPRRYELAREQMLQTYLNYFQDQLRRQPRAAAHRASLRRHAGRRLQRGAEIVRARGLRPAGGALRDLRQARRFHGCSRRAKRSPPIARAISRAPARRGSRKCRSSVAGYARSDPPGLPAEHRALAGQAPVIAGEVAALAEHAVARHHERDRVLADRGADRARGLSACRSWRRCPNRWWRGPSGCAAASPTPAPRSRCRSARRAAAGRRATACGSKMRARAARCARLSST